MRTIRNCNVCVVGGAGFLGSHLVNHLIEDRGCKVSVVDNLVAGRREFVHKDATFYHHDITGSEDHLRNLFKGVQFVFQYAAYPYIPDSFARPLHVCNVNFFGAMKVVNAAQEAGCEGILQVSSAEIYGDGKSRRLNTVDSCSEFCKIDESTEVVPHSSYGVAKAGVDSFVQVAWKERKTPCIALRQFNCVGERETHPYIVPEIIGQLARQQNFQPNPPQIKGLDKFVSVGTPTIRLGNNSFRDFLYAGDAVKIAVELLERGQFGEVYNLGSETGIKMYDLAKLIGKVMGFADVKVEKDEARVRPWEIWMLLSCNDKIKNAVAHVGSASFPDRILPLEEALRRTVEWYESNGRKWAWE